MKCCLNINRKSIQYRDEAEDSEIELEELEEYVDSLRYEDVQILIKEKVEELTDFRFYYQ